MVKEQDLSKVYYHLRKYSVKCNYNAIVYLEYAKRALLAGRMAESYWASTRAYALKPEPFIRSEIMLFKARALLAMKRQEEAIAALKPLVTMDVSSDGQIRVYQEKGHLVLIQAYFDRAGAKRDNNVIYLENLFRNRYPDSRYLHLLKSWQRNN